MLTIKIFQVLQHEFNESLIADQPTTRLLSPTDYRHHRRGRLIPGSKRIVLKQ